MPNPIKIIKAVTKVTKKATVKKSSPATRAKTNAIQKNSVKVKPAAKQKPNRPNEAKTNSQYNSSSGRAYNKATKEYEEGAGRHGNMYEMQAAGREAMFNAPLKRKTSIAGNKLSKIEKNKATTPRTTKSTTWSTKPVVKINSVIKKRSK